MAGTAQGEAKRLKTRHFVADSTVAADQQKEVVPLHGPYISIELRRVLILVFWLPMGSKPDNFMTSA